MTKALFLTLATLATVSVSITASAAAKAPKAQLSATLTSGHVDALKENIELSSNAAGVWTVTIIKDCESFPCAIADVTSSSKTKVVSMMDARAGDGPLEIKFSNGMVLKERATGFGMLPSAERKKIPPFTLDISVNGKVMTLPLYMSSYIKTNTYE